MGVAAIAGRVTEIRSQLAAFRPSTLTTLTPTLTQSTSQSTLTASSTSPSTSSTSGASFAQALGSLQPVDVKQYGNGRIPESALRPVGDTGQRLAAPAAASMEALLGAARRQGITIGITDSYRSYAEQVDLARRKGLYSRGGLAAKPGTSDHGWGLAVDLDLDDRAQAWMRANAGRFGFRETTPREPWHWAFRPTQ